MPLTLVASVDPLAASVTALPDSVDASRSTAATDKPVEDEAFSMVMSAPVLSCRST